MVREETFGPVLTIIPNEDDVDAISIANDSNYGLSAMVLGTSYKRCMAGALQIDWGRLLISILTDDEMTGPGS